ncbi:MAG: four helix bundle protein [Methanocorpusculaceae archaeon]|nr:four helix bundle protein [Methanocorpusculaceae archaeon]
MIEQVYSFEKMEVWQLSRTFVTSIYKLVSSFPQEERYSLCDQIKRAAISVSSNIAEGCSRSSLKEQKHFIEIAYGSLMEVYCQLILAVDLNYISAAQLSDVKITIDRISKMLGSLRYSITQRLNK